MFLQLFTLLPLLLLLLAAVHHYSSRGRHKRAAQRGPPGPLGLPVIGNLHQLGPLLHRSLSEMSRQHGPLMLLHFGSLPVLVVSSADTAQEVMKTSDVTFASRPSTPATRELMYNCADVAFAPYGEHWRQARKLCTVHLLSAKRVQSYAGVRAGEVALMVDKIAAWSASSAGAPVNLSRILNSFANEVISQVAVGRKYYAQEGEKERNAFCEIVEELSTLLGSFDVEDGFPWCRWLGVATAARARMRRCFRRLDAFLQQVVEDHLHRRRQDPKKVDGGGGDLVDVLLSLQADVASPLSRDSMMAIILDMFAAGTDTSYIALEWAMAELLRNPEAMKKSQEEVRGIVNGDTMVTEDELDKMTYLDAVIKEVLRLHPPAPLLLPRESTCDTYVGGYSIPAKTRVLVNAWAIGRDPDNWEAPEEFRPERFSGSSVDFRGQDFRYIPFGAGRRMCPGVTFAVCTIKLALASLLQWFDWTLPDGICREDMDMAEAPGLTTRKKTNLLVVATYRSS